jgi:hypothetical protein
LTRDFILCEMKKKIIDHCIYFILLLIFVLPQLTSCVKPVTPKTVNQKDTTGQVANISGLVEVHDQDGFVTQDFSDIIVTINGCIKRQSGLDASHAYFFDGLPNGIYIITVSKPGYPDNNMYVKILARKDSSYIYHLSGSGMLSSWSLTAGMIRNIGVHSYLGVHDIYLPKQPVNNVLIFKAFINPGKDSLELMATTDSVTIKWGAIPVLYFIGDGPDVSNSHFILEENETTGGKSFLNYPVGSLIKRFGFKHGETLYITSCIGAIPSTNYFSPLGNQVYAPVSTLYPVQKVILP